MTEAFYPIRKNTLMMATTLALLLPFILLCISSVTNMMLYGYGVPLSWLFLAALPLLGFAYKIQVVHTPELLYIRRYIFALPLHTKSYHLKPNDVVAWVPGRKKGAFKLMLNKQSLGLLIDNP